MLLPRRHKVLLLVRYLLRRIPSIVSAGNKTLPDGAWFKVDNHNNSNPINPHEDLAGCAVAGTRNQIHEENTTPPNATSTGKK